MQAQIYQFRSENALRNDLLDAPQAFKSLGYNDGNKQ
jgi:hypothetical protein